jgi:hypothetical protein
VNNQTHTFVTADMTHVDSDRYIIIERDDLSGSTQQPEWCAPEELYLIDLEETDASSVLKIRLVVDFVSASKIHMTSADHSPKSPRIGSTSCCSPWNR